MWRPGSSTSTTRFIRITSTCGSRWTSVFATTSRLTSRSRRRRLSACRRITTSVTAPRCGGLMTEHGMKPDDFLDFVHQIDHSPLTPNAALGVAIEGLPGRKLILTNGTRRHADAVLARLELDRHFEDVFDIIAAELEPKPSPQTYDRFLKAHNIDAGKTAMFDDLARNLVVPHALGMTTVLVVPEHTREVFREGWELEGRDAPHVDHVTDDLVEFLQGLARKL